jgi:glycosyltransferase involved in cell wall biosynthesis
MAVPIEPDQAMKREPTVTVILPAYNSARFLQATLDSIYAQDYDDFEVLVIDDGSTDETPQIAACQESRVRLIRQKNAGISQARNTGLRCARGQFIAFIDHDDLWHPEKLSAQVKALAEADALTGVCYGNFLIWQDTNQPVFPDPTVSSSEQLAELSGWIYHQLLLTNWVLFSTALFRRNVFELVGKFDPELPPADDWDLVLRASRQFKFLRLQSVVALYRHHGEQTSRKCFTRDFQSDLRESTIRRYGLAGPDGQLPEPKKLLDRRLRSHLSHAAMHGQSGSLRTAAKSLASAFCLSPLDWRIWRGFLAATKHAFLRCKPLS